MDQEREPQSVQELAAAIAEMRARLEHLESALKRIASPIERPGATPPPLPAAALSGIVPVKPPAAPPPMPAKPAAESTSGPSPELVVLQACAEGLPRPEQAPIAAGPAAPAPAAPTAPAAPQPPIDKAPVPEPQPLPAAPAKPAAGPRQVAAKGNFEQRIGTKWMLIAGVAALTVGAAWFFKYASDREWITPVFHVVAAAAAGLVMVGLGEWAIRRRMRGFAAGIMGGGTVLLYLVVYVASPNGLPLYRDLINTSAAFVLMCLITAVGVGLSLRTGLLLTAILSLVGAFATPVLLATGHNSQFVLMTYLLAVDVGFLAVALARRWWVLSPLALAGTAALFWGWYGQYYDITALGSSSAFAWAFLAAFAVYGAAGRVLKRIPSDLDAKLLSAGSALLIAFLFVACWSCQEIHAFAIQMLILTAAMMAYFAIFGLRWLLTVPVLEALLAGSLWLGGHFEPWALPALCVYAWCMMGLALAAAAIRPRPEWRTTHIVNVSMCAAGVLAALLAGCQSYQQLHIFAIQVLALSAVLMAYAGIVKLPLLLSVSTAVCLLSGASWIAVHFEPWALPALCVYAWCLLGLALAAAAIRSRPEWRSAHIVNVSMCAAGVLATLLAGCQSYEQLHIFAIQVLALSVVLTVYAGIVRLPRLLSASVAVCLLAGASWIAAYFEPWASNFLCLYAWCFLGIVLAAALALRQTAWQYYHMVDVCLAGSGLVAAMLGAATWLAPSHFTFQLLALDLVVLGLCLWMRWSGIRLAVLIWTAAALAGGDFSWETARWDTWFTVTWAWVFWAVLTTDIFIRAWWKALATREGLDAFMAHAATAMMFAGTYGLLSQTCQPWMGLYTAGLAVAMFLAAWMLARMAARRILGHSYLGSGLVLSALAVPIQFDKASVTVAWAAQGLVTMLLARRLRLRLLFLAAPILLMLGLVHYVVVEIPSDPRMSQTLAAIGQLNITFALTMAAVLGGAILIAAGILRAGRPLFEDSTERVLAAALVVVGGAFFMIVSAWQIDGYGATWCWLALWAAMATVSLRCRSRWLAHMATAVLAAATGKWLAYDTLGIRMAQGATQEALFLNGQFLAGLAIAAAILVFLRLLKTRGMALPRPAAIFCMLLAACVTLWGGSFEIDHYFAANPAGWENPGQALQMGFSLWWALYATALLIFGFALALPALRYMAIVLFALTLGKVLLLDMAAIDLGYRILSFLGLGVLLLAGAWLYHRHFRARAPQEPAEEPKST